MCLNVFFCLDISSIIAWSFTPSLNFFVILYLIFVPALNTSPEYFFGYKYKFFANNLYNSIDTIKQNKDKISKLFGGEEGLFNKMILQ